jgi:hypothetical protein
MHAPRDVHWALIRRILRYVRGTTRHGMHLRGSSFHDLVAYTDADWAGCPDTRRSTSGFCVFIGDSLVSWSSKRQAIVSRSGAKAEHRGLQMLPRNAAGCAIFFANCTFECTRQASYSVIMSQQSILPRIQCTTDEQSLWNLIFTWFGRKQHLGNSEFFMYQPSINLPIS